MKSICFAQEFPGCAFAPPLSELWENEVCVLLKNWEEPFAPMSKLWETQLVPVLLKSLEEPFCSYEWVSFKKMKYMFFWRIWKSPLLLIESFEKMKDLLNCWKIWWTGKVRLEANCNSVHMKYNFVVEFCGEGLNPLMFVLVNLEKI